MNKFCTTERLSGLLALVVSILFYGVVTALILFLLKEHSSAASAFNPEPLTLSFAQIALQATSEPPPVVEPEPVPPPPEEVDVVVEEIPALPEVPPEPVPPPEPQPVVETSARITQAASAPAVPSVDRDFLLRWVRDQIEKEKYYPPAARNAGLEGKFRLLIKIGTDGSVVEAVVLDGTGHPMLRRSLEKIMTGLIGRDSGQPLPAPYAFIQPFGFELK